MCFSLFSDRVGRTDPENDKDGEDVKGNCGKEWVGVALGVAHHWWGAFTYCYMEVSLLPFVFSFVFSFNFFTFFTSKYISSSLEVDAMPWRSIAREGEDQKEAEKIGDGIYHLTFSDEQHHQYQHYYQDMTSIMIIINMTSITIASTTIDYI